MEVAGIPITRGSRAARSRSHQSRVQSQKIVMKRLSSRLERLERCSTFRRSNRISPSTYIGPCSVTRWSSRDRGCRARHTLSSASRIGWRGDCHRASRGRGHCLRPQVIQLLGTLPGSSGNADGSAHGRQSHVYVFFLHRLACVGSCRERASVVHVRCVPGPTRSDRVRQILRDAAARDRIPGWSFKPRAPPGVKPWLFGDGPQVTEMK